jgi:hypothetical protein
MYAIGSPAPLEDCIQTWLREESGVGRLGEGLPVTMRSHTDVTMMMMMMMMMMHQR